MYDQEFFNHIIQLLTDYLDDLEKWSVYNDDKNLEEIQKMFELLRKVANG